MGTENCGNAPPQQGTGGKAERDDSAGVADAVDPESQMVLFVLANCEVWQASEKSVQPRSMLDGFDLSDATKKSQEPRWQILDPWQDDFLSRG